MVSGSPKPKTAEFQYLRLLDVEQLRGRTILQNHKIQLYCEHKKRLFFAIPSAPPHTPAGAGADPCTPLKTLYRCVCAYVAMGATQERQGPDISEEPNPTFLHSIPQRSLSSAIIRHIKDFSAITIYIGLANSRRPPCKVRRRVPITRSPT